MPLCLSALTRILAKCLHSAYMGGRPLLTEKRIRDAKAGEKTRFLWDEQVTNLGVRVTRAGVMSFVLFYRIAGRKHLATLARCSELSLKDARERAGRELAAIREGIDPLERRRQAKVAPTVADLIDQFLTVEGPARISHGRMTERTLQEYRKQARAYLLPALGKRGVASVKRGDVEHMVARLPAPTRNRVLALTSRLFTLAERWQWRAQNDNPARGIERSREEARDRVLAPSELAALAAALDGLEDQYPAPVAAIRFAAVTGLRIGEVLAIQWAHIDFETGRLTMPKTKSGRRVHDISTTAVEVLSALPRINDWAFTAVRDAPVTYRYVRTVFAEAAKAAGIADVRLHDLRRTVMTSAAAAGIGTHVLRDLLGHKSTVMADRYIRHVGNPVREAREQVGAAMASMMRGETGDVVPMRPRRGR